MTEISPSPPFVATVEAYVRRHAMFGPGDRVAVAVSGGGDSTGLLHFLAQVAEPWGLQLSVVHIDHGLRPTSAADAEFVAALAIRLGLPVSVCRVAPGDIPTPNQEQHARRARYGIFRELMASGAATCVATAHSADDQAETVLLRLLRGSGIAGLAAILPVRAVSEAACPGGTTAEIVRPFLTIRRQQIRDWLRDLGEPWCEDESNKVLARHERNRIRHELLPRLERDFAPGLVERLGSLAELARAEEETAAAQVAVLAARLWSQRSGRDGWQIDRSELAAQPIAWRRRLVREGIRLAKGDLRGIDFDQVEGLLDWVGDQMPEAQAPRLIELPGVRGRLDAVHLQLWPARPPKGS